jgi:hypothetical protein
MTAARTAFRRQVRNFVVVWMGITLVIGAVTFIAVYMTYPSLNPGGGDLRSSAALPTNAATRVVQAATATLQPTATEAQAFVLPTVTPRGATAESLAAPVETSIPPTSLPVDDRRFQLGVQVQVSYDNMSGWMDVAANQLSMEWVKFQVRWENVEPEQGAYDWFEPDTFLPAAQAQGLKVLISVVTAPDWARESGVNLDAHGPPADPNVYAEFVTTMLERYPHMIHAVEVWNEMNLDREWTSTRGLVAANYVELLRTTYQAIKAVDPGVIVVSGALSPTGLSDGVRAWDDFAYMDQLIAAGMLNYADCVGAHHNGYNLSPQYTWDNAPNDPAATFRGPFDNPHHSWSFRSTLETYADRIALAGGSQKLCVTEFGWPSAEGLEGVRQGFEFARDNTLEEQRDWTVQAIEFMRDSDFVQLAFLWNLNYGPQAGWAVDNDNVPYSIIGPNFVFRPVFDAVRDWNRANQAQ